MGAAPSNSMATTEPGLATGSATGTSAHRILGLTLLAYGLKFYGLLLTVL